MKVGVLCEFTGTVRDAFTARGHDAVSCDIQPTEAEGPHIVGDCLDQDWSGFDLLICHPPCTHLSKAGGWCWKFKKAEQAEALAFVQAMMELPCERIAIENPVGKINTAIRKPEQIIHPWQFGDPWMKETCLWLKGLPRLDPTNIVRPRGNWVKPGNRRPHRRFDDVPEGGRGNWKDRSRTFPGIAAAMAAQWGDGEPSPLSLFATERRTA